MHRIFQRHGITPDEIYNKEPRFKRFIYASELLAIEEEKRLEQEK